MQVGFILHVCLRGLPPVADQPAASKLAGKRVVSQDWRPPPARTCAHVLTPAHKLAAQTTSSGKTTVLVEIGSFLPASCLTLTPRPLLRGASDISCSPATTAAPLEQGKPHWVESHVAVIADTQTWSELALHLSRHFAHICAWCQVWQHRNPQRPSVQWFCMGLLPRRQPSEFFTRYTI